MWCGPPLLGFLAEEAWPGRQGTLGRDPPTRQRGDKVDPRAAGRGRWRAGRARAASDTTPFAEGTRCFTYYLQQSRGKEVGGVEDRVGGWWGVGGRSGGGATTPRDTPSRGNQIEAWRGIGRDRRRVVLVVVGRRRAAACDAWARRLGSRQVVPARAKQADPSEECFVTTSYY